MKKLVAIFLSVIMILSCTTGVFAENAGNNSYSIIYTEKFMEKVTEYMDYIGSGVIEPDTNFESILPDGKVVLYYKGLQIYSESNNRVIFGLSDYWCTITEEVIDGYVFTNPSFYGHHLKENPTGLCVYQDGKVCSIREAVDVEIITVEELAEVIPFTVKENETTPPPTISTKPSSTATMPSTNETDDIFEPLPTNVDDVPKKTEPTEVEPLPTVVIETTEMPTEGAWLTPTESTEIIYTPDDETVNTTPTKQTDPTEETFVTEPATSSTEPTEELVAEQQVKIKSKVKKVKFSKVKKAKQTVSNAITIENYQGKLKYKKVEKGSSKYLNINKNSGKITIKKGAKKGVHKIKVKITSKGKARSKSLSKIVVVKIKVK